MPSTDICDMKYVFFKDLARKEVQATEIIIIHTVTDYIAVLLDYSLLLYSVQLSE
jgi:hypothetical protein